MKAFQPVEHKSPGPAPPAKAEPKPPPKNPKHVRLNVPPPKPPRARARRRQLNPENSVTMSVSMINPNMSVLESVLGKSVAPFRRKKKKEGGHRILCLDGGGVKVRCLGYNFVEFR